MRGRWRGGRHRRRGCSRGRRHHRRSGRRRHRPRRAGRRGRGYQRPAPARTAEQPRRRDRHHATSNDTSPHRCARPFRRFAQHTNCQRHATYDGSGIDHQRNTRVVRKRSVGEGCEAPAVAWPHDREVPLVVRRDGFAWRSHPDRSRRRPNQPRSCTISTQACCVRSAASGNATIGPVSSTSGISRDRDAQRGHARRPRHRTWPSHRLPSAGRWSTSAMPSAHPGPSSGPVI